MQVVAREDGFVFFAVKHQFAVAADPHVGDVFVVAEIQLDAFFEVVEGVDAEVAVAADKRGSGRASRCGICAGGSPVGAAWVRR